MTLPMINEWLRPVGPVAGQPLALDEQGLLGLELDSGLQCVIELDADGEMLTFHSELLHVAPSQVPVICQYAMEKNVYGLGSCGITLGYERRRSTLVASVCYPVATLTDESFIVHLERFIAGIERLHHDFQHRDAAMGWVGNGA
jgi:hypothetical protein